MNVELPRPIRRLVNAFPDVNEQSPEQQAALGTVFSILMHLGIFAIWISLETGWVDRIFQVSPKPQEPVEILIKTIEPDPPEKVVVPLDQLKEPPRVDSAGLQESEKPKTVAVFQSDKNLDQGSLVKAEGSAPVPSNAGRLSEGERSMIRQDYKVGALDAKQSLPGAVASKLSSSKRGQKTMVAAKNASMSHQSGVEATRFEDMPELNGELVFRRLASGPSKANKGEKDSDPDREQDKAIQKNLSESDVIDDLFQEGKELTDSKGAVSKNGKLGVDAVKTPTGDYKKSVSRIVGVHWNRLVREREESLEPGLVKVHMWIAQDGVLRKVTVDRCTSNQKFADLCLEALRRSKLDPIPPEMQGTLRDGVLEMFYTFNLY